MSRFKARTSVWSCCDRRKYSEDLSRTGCGSRLQRSSLACFCLALRSSTLDLKAIADIVNEDSTLRRRVLSLSASVEELAEVNDVEQLIVAAGRDRLLRFANQCLISNS